MTTLSTRTYLHTKHNTTTNTRYGDEQHLDEALNRIWMFGRAGNPPRKMCPTLVGLREEVVDVSELFILRTHSAVTGVRAVSALQCFRACAGRAAQLVMVRHVWNWSRLGQHLQAPTRHQRLFAHCSQILVWHSCLLLAACLLLSLLSPFMPPPHTMCVGCVLPDP